MKAFFKKFSLENSFEAFVDTVKRFPLSSMCGMWAFVFVIIQLHFKDWMEDETVGRLILSFVLGYLWFGVCQIYAEAKNLNALKHGALAIIGFAPLLFITFGATDEFFRLVFIFPALLLLIMVAPFFLSKNTDESFWVFNRHLWFGVAVAIVASLLLMGGASAALAAIKYLFDVNIPEESFGDIVAFCSFVLGPIYALSFIPKAFEFKDSECHTPPQVGFIVSWIFAPLVITYMAILYAYFLKIGVTWDIPKGQLSYMIVGFIGIGLVTYLISWPFHGDGYDGKQKGGRALNFIVKYFFAAMIIPVLVQAFSIGLRIHQYGVTEKRYVVAMAALWFGFIAVGFLIKKLQLKHIPLSLAILLLLGSVGPWSARDVSAWSQVGRLEAVLKKHNLLVDGKIVKAEEELPFEVRKNISGISDYVFRHKHEFYGHENNYDFFKDLGFKYLSRWERKNDDLAINNERFNYYSTTRNYGSALDVRGVDYYIQSQYIGISNSKKVIRLDDKVQIELKGLRSNIMTISVVETGEKIRFDLNGAIEKLLKENTSKNLEKPVVVNAQSQSYKVRGEIMSVNGKVTAGKPEISSASMSLYITKK